MSDVPQFINNDNEPLYDPVLLQQIDFTKYSLKENSYTSLLHPGDGLNVRPLNSGDYDKCFLKLLETPASMSITTHDNFYRKFEAMKKCNNSYYVTVIEDSRLKQVIAAATLLVEQKFLRDAGLRGHLEDVVVKESYRGKRLGKLIVNISTALAEHLGCYKITLSCKDTLVPFYSRLGYSSEPDQSTNAMTIRFSPPYQGTNQFVK